MFLFGKPDVSPFGSHRSGSPLPWACRFHADLLRPGGTPFALRAVCACVRVPSGQCLAAALDRAANRSAAESVRTGTLSAAVGRRVSAVVVGRPR